MVIEMGAKLSDIIYDGYKSLGIIFVKIVIYSHL